MKNKLEQKIDTEYRKLGINPRVYHFKTHIMPFAGITIITADREGSFRTVKVIVQKEISMHTLEKATKTKKNLNDLGIFGVAICDRRDTFNRQRGRIIAKGRLLKHLKEMKK